MEHDKQLNASEAKFMGAVGKVQKSSLPASSVKGHDYLLQHHPKNTMFFLIWVHVSMWYLYRSLRPQVHACRFMVPIDPSTTVLIAQL